MGVDLSFEKEKDRNKERKEVMKGKQVDLSWEKEGLQEEKILKN